LEPVEHLPILIRVLGCHHRSLGITHRAELGTEHLD
jgi:hypothetical protein